MTNLLCNQSYIVRNEQITLNILNSNNVRLIELQQISHTSEVEKELSDDYY